MTIANETAGRLDDLFTRILSHRHAPETPEIAPCDLWAGIRRVDRFYIEPAVEIGSETQMAEKVRELRTNILSLQAARSVRSILFTSCHHGEGKTTTTLNLARYMAKNEGSRVLLVDCDLRRPSLKTFMNWDVEVGLDDVLNGKGSLGEAIVHSERDNLSVLFTRYGHVNASEMLEKPVAADIVRQLNQNFDLVIYDAPPLLSTTDPTVMGKLIDGIVLIVKAGETQRESVEHAVNLLGQTRIPVLGIVLTHLRYYLPRYLYKYNYYQDSYSYYGEERRKNKR